MNEVSSPCIDECYLDENVCPSCGRTWEQIIKWGQMSEEERQEIMESL